MISRSARRWLLRIALAIIPSVALIGGIEVALRIAGYGFDPHFFVAVENGRGTRRANERFAWRFMPPTLARSPSPEQIAVPKPPGTRRIFLLGSSAAMGYPNPAFGVGRMLEVMLRAAHPGERIEVVNTAMTAINSHVVAEIARECRAYEPDMFVVFTGNNEVVGPYGPGTIFSGVRSNRLVIRAGMELSSWRVGQWMSRLSAGGKPVRWGGMEMFAGHEVSAGDPRLPAVYENYRANLASICRSGWSAGARVVLCTVPVNLRDCAPFASPEAALRFARGRELWEAGQTAEARGHFVAARDLDALRFRADSPLVAAARALPADDAQPGLTLADLEAGIGRISGSAPGGDFFLEHVHLNFAGNHAAALLILEAIEPGAARRAPTVEACAAALAYTPWEAFAEAKQVLELLQRPPFGPEHENLRRGIRESFDRARTQMQRPGAAAEARATHEKAAHARPDDFWTAYTFAGFLAQTGDVAGEAAARRRVVELRPEAAHAKVELARALWKAGHPSEARRFCELAEKQLPGNAALLKAIGDILLENREFDSAAKQLRAALAIQPDHPAALLNLAAAVQMQGNVAEAERLLHRSLELQDDAAARTNLGNLLVRQRRGAEALPHFEAAAKLDPGEASARHNFGAALLGAGRVAEAEDTFRTALAIDPRHVRAEFSLGQICARRGEWREAEAHWRAVLARQPGFLPAGRELAWLLATAPDDAVRRADEALAIASQLRQAAPDNPPVLDALAAAYANAGRFDDAAATATRAADIAEGAADPSAAEIRKRAALYRLHQPFRAKP